MRAVVVIGALVFVSLATGSAATAGAAFATPGKAAFCGVAEGEPPLTLICWRPRDGITLDMTGRGRPHRSLYPPNMGADDAVPGRFLSFGKIWRFPDHWKCVSRATGLTCTNRTGHGWWLGRVRGSRVF
jgi:hypothetical protein